MKTRNWIKNNFEFILFILSAMLIGIYISIVQPKGVFDYFIDKLIIPIIALISAVFVYLGFSEAKKSNKIITDEPGYKETQRKIDDVEIDFKSRNLCPDCSTYFDKPSDFEIQKAFYFSVYPTLWNLSISISKDKHVKELISKIKRLKDNSKDGFESIEKNRIKNFSTLHNSVNSYLNEIEHKILPLLDDIKQSKLIKEYKKLLFKDLKNLIADFSRLATDLENNTNSMKNPDIPFESPMDSKYVVIKLFNEERIENIHSHISSLLSDIENSL